MYIARQGVGVGVCRGWVWVWVWGLELEKNDLALVTLSLIACLFGEKKQFVKNDEWVKLYLWNSLM